jgi:tRNA (guanine-N7-)-methyltransferase
MQPNEIVDQKLLERYERGQLDLTYSSQFRYAHKNPYHEKLSEFSHFVLRDEEGEELRGSWNASSFKREAPLHVEIGAGYGHFMREFCQANRNVNFVAMDYRFKRSYELAQKLDRLKLKHCRYLRAKGERLGYLFDENEIDEMYLFFPDPWPKKRHHKNRLFAPPFLSLAHKLLKPGGKLWVKTDHDHYYEWMKFFLSRDKNFEVELLTGDLYEDNPDHFLAGFQTKFEKIFLRKGIKIKAIALRNK